MKNIFKVIFISFIVLLTGCEAEKEFAKQNKIIVRPFSMKSMTAKTNSKLSQAVNSIRKIKVNTTTESSNSKLVFDEKAGLYFDDEKGLYIEKDNLKSYTFPIIRTSADEKIKNICFNEKLDGNYDVFLVKYDLKKEEVLNLTEEQKALREKQFVALMKDGVNIDSFRFQCINITLTTTTEYAPPIDNGDLTGNFGYNTVSHTTTVVIGSSCYFDNGSSGAGFNQGIGSNGSFNSSGATGSGSSSNTQSGSDIITGLNTQDFGNSLTDGELFYYNYTSFINRLNDEQKQVFDNHPECAIYLVRNNWSIYSQNFVKEMIDATINGIDVDYVKKTIYGINKPCQKEIIKDIVDTCSPFTELIQQTFNSTDNANIRFSNGNIPNTNAYTSPNWSGTPQNFTINIKFDDSFLNTSTNLGIISVTLHELVHAYLINLYIKGTLVATDSNYNTLLNAFIAFYNNQVQDTFDPLDNEIHNAMKNFIEKMANSIYNYATSKGITVTPEYCVKLAWGTMSGTDLFLTVLTTEQQQDYGNTFAIEQDNIQSEAPKGVPCS